VVIKGRREPPFLIIKRPPRAKAHSPLLRGRRLVYEILLLSPLLSKEGI
jgi:hypothetical protein